MLLLLISVAVRECTLWFQSFSISWGLFYGCRGSVLVNIYVEIHGKHSPTKGGVYFSIPWVTKHVACVGQWDISKSDINKDLRVFATWAWPLTVPETLRIPWDQGGSNLLEIGHPPNLPATSDPYDAILDHPATSWPARWLSIPAETCQTPPDYTCQGTHRMGGRGQGMLIVLTH